ncbi:substrate-binding domain-containing protein [Micromonospora sp. CA-246542]|uniref:substrate-binding domain-containing protein n=1 Tax=Micromonospora sp. CA-246542 TaxID=3239959 RepID=UPI003D8CCD86
MRGRAGQHHRGPAGGRTPGAARPDRLDRHRLGHGAVVRRRQHHRRGRGVTPPVRDGPPSDRHGDRSAVAAVRAAAGAGVPPPDARGRPAGAGRVGDFTAARGREAAGEALRRWPDVDAIYAISDETALGVIAELREEGVRVPGDVAVAGFDDIPLAGMTAPALTTASHPVGRIAAAAAAAVLAGRPGAPVTLFPSDLVTRDSA